MVRRGEKFSGLSVALVTPMSADGSLNEAMLRELIDFHVASGTDCVVPVGTTGESPTLTHDEHERVIAVTCEHAAGRIKVMAGTGSNSTSEAIRLTKAARHAGADGALMVAPYYNKPTQEGFFLHFRAVAEHVDLPIVLYNIPAELQKIWNRKPSVGSLTPAPASSPSRNPPAPWTRPHKSSPPQNSPCSPVTTA
ncbi:MAG UNVERIFIED_CONTAM: dihydrodipicolinate synthase family protein [Planctomycetaceae bacterium]